MCFVSTFDPVVRGWDRGGSGEYLHVCMGTHGLEEDVNLLQSKFHIKKKKKNL